MKQRAGFRSAVRVSGAASAWWAVLILALSGSAVQANTYTVTNTNDSNIGSLRQAITDANGNVGADTIEFAIDTTTDPGCTGTPKVCTILPATTLPSITDPVTIDGYTQPGASANTLAVGDDAVIVVAIDGTNTNPVLLLDGTVGSGGASGSTIRGLALTRIASNGIRATHVENLTVAGNFIGTDASGTVGTSTGQYGIYADDGDAAIIGGTDPAARNIFASMSTAIFLEGTNSGEFETNCLVEGNYIGLDRTGTQPLPVVSGIALRATSNCRIGGSASGAGNVIGSTQQGISIDAEFADGGPIDTTIQGNLIGTDVTGTVARGQFDGIVIGLSDGTAVGGSVSGEGNLISGNAADGIVFGNSPTNTLIEGNEIGTDVAGNLPLGNGWCGIDIGGASTNGTVGGTDVGTANVIAFNGTNGIQVASLDQIANWSIEGNSIHDNGSLGIVLNGVCDSGASHPTDNDIDDGDTGPNDLQNYPVITDVTVGPETTVQVTGTLNSTADSMFHLEFFANARCDNSNPIPGTDEHTGEGKIFLGSLEVVTIGNDASFGPLDFTVPADRHVITATATRLDNGSTSEFSVCSDQDTIFADAFEGD